MSLAYGLWCIVWVAHDLPRYHRWLKNEYSYQENINLHWLRGVTLLFFIILCIWVVDCIYPSTLIDTIYILSSLVGWMVVCYFINRQELVIKEVIDSLPTETAEPLAPAAADIEPINVYELSIYFEDITDEAFRRSFVKGDLVRLQRCVNRINDVSNLQANRACKVPKIA